MSQNTNQPLQKGDKITVGKWIKKLGKIPIEEKGKPRNVFALCQKGKLVVAIKCEAEDAETIVNDSGELLAFKRISLDTEVSFGEDIINVFPIDKWKKATQKNLFLGMLEEYREKHNIVGDENELDK